MSLQPIPSLIKIRTTPKAQTSDYKIEPNDKKFPNQLITLNTAKHLRFSPPQICQQKILVIGDSNTNKIFQTPIAPQDIAIILMPGSRFYHIYTARLNSKLVAPGPDIAILSVRIYIISNKNVQL